MGKGKSLEELTAEYKQAKREYKKAEQGNDEEAQNTWKAKVHGLKIQIKEKEEAASGAPEGGCSDVEMEAEEEAEEEAEPAPKKAKKATTSSASQVRTAARTGQARFDMHAGVGGGMHCSTHRQG